MSPLVGVIVATCGDCDDLVLIYLYEDGTSVMTTVNEEEEVVTASHN